MADLTTDVALLAPDEHDTLHVLLLRSSQTSDAAAGMLALPSGHLNDDERAHTAALRVLTQETGIELHDDELLSLGYQDHPGRNLRGRTISFPFVALTSDIPEVTPSPNIIDYVWVPAEMELDLDEPLAFDHTEIVVGAIHHQAIREMRGHMEVV